MTFHDFLFLLPVLIFVGALAGFMAGLLGIGGGLVIVPALYYLFSNTSFFEVDSSIKMKVAVGTSLATIVFTSCSSLFAHHKKKGVDWSLARMWAPPILVGVLAGSLLGASLDGQLIFSVFGFVVLLIALNMVFGKKEAWVQKPVPFLFQNMIGILIGFISSLMGMGGGALTVPTLSYLNYPIRRAIGTSSLIGLVISLPGSMGYIYGGLEAQNLPPFSLGFVNGLLLLVLVPMTTLMAPIGAKMAYFVHQKSLKTAFAIFLFITSIKMLDEAFGLLKIIEHFFGF